MEAACAAVQWQRSLANCSKALPNVLSMQSKSLSLEEIFLALTEEAPEETAPEGKEDADA